MRFQLLTLMFFSDANWCWPAGGFEKVGLKLDFFPLGLHGVIGSSDRSLKIEWVDKPCEKRWGKRREKWTYERSHIDAVF